MVGSTDGGLLQPTVTPMIFPFVQDAIVNCVNYGHLAPFANPYQRQVPIMKTGKVGNPDLLLPDLPMYFSQETRQQEQARQEEFKPIAISGDGLKGLAYGNRMVFGQVNQAIFNGQMVDQTGSIVGIAVPG